MFPFAFNIILYYFRKYIGHQVTATIEKRNSLKMIVPIK